MTLFSKMVAEVDAVDAELRALVSHLPRAARMPPPTPRRVLSWKQIRWNI